MGTNGQDVQDNVVMLRGVPADKISGGWEYHADYIFNGNGPVKPADGDIYGDVVFGNDALLAWDDGVTRTHGDYYFLGDSRQDAKNSFKMNVNGSKQFQDNGFVFFNRILNTNDIISQSLATSSTNRFLLMSGGAGYADPDMSLLQGSGSQTGMLYDRITASQESDLSVLRKKAFKYYDYLKYGVDEYPVYDSVANYIENSNPNENIMSLNEFASRYSYGNSHAFVPSGSY
ncbi:MAG: hypothetical protein II108_05605, partial [Clostridiales bacterium]|nr:hypothetical protein [Clostridiales bacterium]